MRARACRSFGETGFVVVFTALAIFVLVLLVGFGVDLGSWYLSASKMQRAADAAALAASAQLPDTDAAQKAALDAYSRNGYKDGQNHIKITTNITASDVSTTINDSDVATYFLRLIMPSIGMSRTSESNSPSTAPVLGSPYNVLGTGDLNVPGLPKPQNFWLAVNGVCAPKEDGDYFDARYDHTKGPLTGALKKNDYVPAPNARTHCPDPADPQGYSFNPEFEDQGYSYFINVPKPPAGASNPTVKIEIYDPQFDAVGQPPYYRSPDYGSSMPLDDAYIGGSMAWDLYNTNGTPLDPSDDSQLLPHPVGMDSYGDDPRWKPDSWWTMYTIPSSEIANGGLFRVQVVPMEVYYQVVDNAPEIEASQRGVDAFSIGAFASWESNGSVGACNSDSDINCPRVYGLGAVSVYNNISGGSSGSQDDFYLADITPQYVGQTFDVLLWDPGEGTQGIQIVAPNGTPLSFTYTSGGSTPGDVGPSSNSEVKTLDTSGIDGHAIDPVTHLPTLSNNFVFNDRLVTLRITIPVNYSSMAVGNDNWLRLRYIVSSSSPNDRTTWGIATPGAGLGGPSHLTLPGT